jgi:hypothetical protein
VRVTQGIAIGLGYVGLSVRNGAMKNVCDKAKYPPDTPKLCLVRLKAWHTPAQWHRLGLRIHQPDRRALKGQHIDRKIWCKYEWAVWKNMVCSLPAGCGTTLSPGQTLPAGCATILSPDQTLPVGCGDILSPGQTLPAGCGDILSSDQTLPAGCGMTLSSVFFLDSAKMERKKQDFSFPKPYFQPYFLNKTTLVARKNLRLHKPY